MTPWDTMTAANEFIERQTRQIEREFKTSHPKPRNRQMGFKPPQFQSIKRNHWASLEGNPNDG